jgi:hypothetical protein
MASSNNLAAMSKSTRKIGHGTTIKLYLPLANEAEDVEVAVDNGPIVV